MKTLFSTFIFFSLTVSLLLAQNVGNDLNFAMETRGSDGIKVLKAEEEQMIFERLRDDQAAFRSKSITEMEMENRQLSLIKKQLDAAISELDNQNHLLETNTDLLDQKIDELQKTRSLIVTSMEALWRENEILLQNSESADEWTEEEIGINREQIQVFEMKINDYERQIAHNESKIRDYEDLIEENSYSIEKNKEIAEACEWMKESNDDRINRMR